MKPNNSDERVTQHLRRLAFGQPAGTRLASVRALMQQLGVGPATVQRAMGRLAQEGVLEARPGHGTFVAAPARPQSRGPDLAWQSLALGPARSMAGGLGSLCVVPPDDARALNAGYLPEDLQATALLQAAAARALRRPGIWARMPVEGLPSLRAWFASAVPGAFQPHEVTICPGTQPALSAAFRALAQPGEPVLVESPTYLGAIAAAQAAGLRLVPVPTDADGVRPEALEEAFARTASRLFYCQPTYANPTGAVLSVPRRADVLAVVERAGAFLIEDDWARDFALEGEPPRPLAQGDPDGHVIYVRSLTKSVAPGLRIGAVCAKGAALERLRAARLVDDFFVPGFLQEVAVQLITAPGWARHLRGLRAALQQRRDALAAALRATLGPGCVVVPRGGLHLWVALPAGVSDLAVAQQAAASGILVSAGRHWFPAEAAGPFLRLSFAAARLEWSSSCAGELAAVVQAVGAQASAG